MLCVNPKPTALFQEDGRMESSTNQLLQDLDSRQWKIMISRKKEGGRGISGIQERSEGKIGVYKGIEESDHDAEKERGNLLFLLTSWLVVRQRQIKYI